MVVNQVLKVSNLGASRSEVWRRGDQDARRRMVWSWAAMAWHRGASRSGVWCRGDWDDRRRMVSNPVSMVSNRGVG